MQYPKLRYVDAFPVDTENGQMFAIRDPRGISPEILVVSPDVFHLLQFFDGTHSQDDLIRKYTQIFGSLLQKAQLIEILENLNLNLFLENQSFLAKLKKLEDEFKRSSVRPAAHAGQSYEADPEKLKLQINGFFEDPKGAGLPEKNGKAKSVRGLIAPHIDIRAGGPCYSHAYRALAEADDVDCFIILGTGHSGLTDLYSSISMDFGTPFGTAKCDKEFIQQLTQNYPRLANSEAVPHKSEHVIEFQLVFLNYLFQQQKRNFSFVPILCSFPFQALKDERFDREKTIIDEFTAALKKTISEFGKKVCIIASVDFCHIGLQYGDEAAPDEKFMQKVKHFDTALTDDIASLNVGAFVETVAQCDDKYRVCGFSSIYTMLQSMDAKEGKLLDYARTEVDDEKSTVTFASMAFY